MTRIGIALVAVGGIGAVLPAFVHRTSEPPSSESREAGFYCGNHEPSHYARTAAEAERYSETEGCEGWSSVSDAIAQGSVVDEEDRGVGGARIVLFGADGLVITASATDPFGQFQLVSPLAGQYIFGVDAIGFRAFRQPVDAEILIAEGIRVSLEAVNP